MGNMDTVQQTIQNEEYQISLAKRVLIWMLVEILWLTGYFLMVLSTVVMCVVTLLNGMDNAFIPDWYTKYKNIFLADYNWLTVSSHWPVPIDTPISNAICLIPFLVGLVLFHYFSPSDKADCLILGVSVLTLIAMYWLVSRYLGGNII